MSPLFLGIEGPIQLLRIEFCYFYSFQEPRTLTMRLEGVLYRYTEKVLVGMKAAYK